MTLYYSSPHDLLKIKNYYYMLKFIVIPLTWNFLKKFFGTPHKETLCHVIVNIVRIP